MSETLGLGLYVAQVASQWALAVRGRSCECTCVVQDSRTSGCGEWAQLVREQLNRARAEAAPTKFEGAWSVSLGLLLFVLGVALGFCLGRCRPARRAATQPAKNERRSAPEAVEVVEAAELDVNFVQPKNSPAASSGPQTPSSLRRR